MGPLSVGLGALCTYLLRNQHLFERIFTINIRFLWVIAGGRWFFGSG
jgi:hypothetical protein